MATLPPAEESFVTGLLAEKPYPAAPERDAGLLARPGKEHSPRASGRIGKPYAAAETGPEETARLQKEILDLHLRLKQVARL